MDRRAALSLSPAACPLALVLAGLGLTVAQSFGFFLPVPAAGGRFDGYAALLAPHLVASFAFSALVALASVLLSLACGTLIAWRIWQLSPKLKPLALVYKVPLILPHIAVAFIVLIVFSGSGVLASAGHALGLVATPADFPAILFSGNGLGLILAYALKETPFVTLMVLALLARLDPRLVQAARMLGASGTRVFFTIAVPHVRPALEASGIILFLYAFGAYDIPALLSESSPGMLSITVFDLIFQRDLALRPRAMALLVVMFLFAAAFIWAYVRLAARLSSRERKL